MSFPPTACPSPFVKMRQVYWETKQSFNKSLGQREDSCLVSSDSELDIKLELLQAADNSFNALMAILLNYRSALKKYVDAQDNLGLALIEYGTKDCTAAGRLMCMCGKAISKAAQRQSLLKTSLMNLFHEVQTFQFKATADTLQTVTKMEKVRRSYRSGLMWMKNESTDLDPDVSKKLKNFRKVQEHIKHLKVRFDRVKLESMQKIDLLLFSRSNLFSHTLVPYSKMFKKTSRYSVIFLDFALKNIPLYLSFNFVALKELNQYSKILQSTFQQLYSIEQASNKQAKNKNKISTGRSKSSLVDKSSYEEESKENFTAYSNLIDIGLDQDVLSPKNDALLIDLNEQGQRRNQSLMTTETYKQNRDPFVSKYSDDLLHIKLEPKPNFHCKSYTQYQNFGKEYESLIGLLDPVPQQQVKDSNELHFWTLIQSYGSQKKNSKNSEISEGANSTLAPVKVTSNIQSQSKWNDILVEFDPFTDQSKGSTNDKKALERC